MNRTVEPDITPSEPNIIKPGVAEALNAGIMDFHTGRSQKAALSHTLARIVASPTVKDAIVRVAGPEADAFDKALNDPLAPLIEKGSSSMMFAVYCDEKGDLQLSLDPSPEKLRPDGINAVADRLFHFGATPLDVEEAINREVLQRARNILDFVNALQGGGEEV